MTSVFSEYSTSFFINVITNKIEASFMHVMLKTLPIVLGAFILRMIMIYIQGIFKNNLRKDFRNDIKEKIVDKLNSLSYKDIKNVDQGTYISWFSVDIEQISETAFSTFFSLVTNSLMYIISSGILYINIFARIMAIILAILMLVFPPLLDKTMKTVSKEKTRANEEFLSDAKNYITGYDIFILSNLRKIFKEKIMLSSETLEKVELRFKNKLIFVESLRILLLGLPLITMFAIAAYTVYKNNLPIYQFLGIIRLTSLSFNSLSTVFVQKATINTTIPIFEKYLLDKKDENRNENIDKLNEISVNNITFSYVENKNILNDYSTKFTFPNKYFLVGKSGGGKSTLVKLIQGLYKVNSGDILLDGKNINNISEDDIRNNIGYLSQDIYLFNASIRDNITLWQEFSEESIWEALRICQIDDFVKTLPNGLDTRIEENAKNISGGQKQRLGLARLIIRKLRFLVIDEGTSQLDKISREKIEDILLNLNDISVLIITHNLRENISNYNVINV